ncbi:type I secretion system permease/ATPase [Sphingobium fuliginis]|uniref:Type I secretion system permease/ATPase n=1 Tax=Sphingobium fuliginis ATCC 27551 TaxID=1208342 RepID=A0A5B8CA76_SPHSA|nr:type I secretion system permease/ATPase [Sphingobium fuliginis]QDC36354.1 type I secretion system permease/ATPase [Sphingobium fuliginis ATCC 27551]
MADREIGAGRNWIAAIVALAGLKGIGLTEAELTGRLAWSGHEGDPRDELRQAARLSGIQLDLVDVRPDEVPDMMLPALFEMREGVVAVLHRRGADSVLFSVPGLSGQTMLEIPRAEFAEKATGRAGLVEALSTRARDARIDAFLRKSRRSWFWDTVLSDRRGYGEIVLASLFGNLLTFGTSLFAMQVWDRVIPARSIPTLWVLALGTLMALLLELLLRTSRVVVVDRIGRRADLAISSRIFARALDIRNDARPKSTGAFIAQLRDIEQIRELLTSTTVSALVDLPFIILFLALFTMLAGPLTFVLVAALILIVVPGLLLQIPLGRLAKEGMREAALRNAMLVESIERIDEIKTAQAEPRFQSLWERFTVTGARVGAEQRFFAALFSNWSQTLQQLAYTAVVVAGAYRVMDGDMTMGALIACSILTSRALVLFVPLGQVFTRWQSAKVAIGALNDIMEKPVDHDPEAGLLRRTLLRGNYEIENLLYAYDAESPAVLRIDRLSIRQGERIALLGKIGAGKSTLLRQLSGLARPTSGKLLLDGTSMALINPADIRRETGYLGQGAQLFLGTIRENLLVGAPHASDEDIVAALAVTGGLPLVQNQSQGLDLLLQEGGAGLSGGQRQTLLLARTLLRKGNILLLDEPSAPLDENSERHLVRELSQWLGDRTLIVTTNRSGLLGLVDRIIVIERGAVVMDGPRDKVIATLAGPRAGARVTGGAQA